MEEIDDVAFEAAVTDGLCSLFAIEGIITAEELRDRVRRHEVEITSTQNLTDQGERK